MIYSNFRCLSLIAKCLEETQLAIQSPAEHELPDKDFLIMALDLLSGLAEGLSGNIESFVASSHIVALIYQCSLVINCFRNYSCRRKYLFYDSVNIKVFDASRIQVQRSDRVLSLSSATWLKLVIIIWNLTYVCFLPLASFYEVILFIFGFY